MLALKVVFQKGKQGNKFFRMTNAFKMFENLIHDNYEIKSYEIEDCFIFSQMTVVNDAYGADKHNWVYFCEWLEFICRIAIVGINMQDTLEYKV